MKILEKYLVPLMNVADGPSGSGAGSGGGGSDPGSSAGSGSSGASSATTAPPSPSSAPAPSATPSSAPSAAPSAAPAASPAAGPAEPGAPPELDFESIFSPPESTEAPLEPAVAPAASAAVPPVVPPVAPVQAPVEPTRPQATQPQPAAPAPASLDPADPMALAQALGQNESAAIDHIASSMFQLSKEEVEALESDVVGTIPKLLAKSFVKAQQMMLSQMGRIVPQMMQRQIEAVRKNSGNEQKFFQRWPQLKGQGDLVRRLAATYRSMNPNATLDAMIEELGPLTMMAAKIPLTAGTAAVGVPQPAPTTTPAAQPGNGVRPPQPSPFVPAVGGPGSTPATTELSPWEAMFSPQE